MTTHNIQFGVNIDDESIIQGVERAAIQSIQTGMFGRIGDPYGTFTRAFTRDFLEGYFDKLFQDPAMREALIKATAENLAGRLMRASTFRKKLEEKFDLHL